MNFTLNNHLRYTIGGREFGYRKTPYEKYEVFVGDIDPDHFKNSSWRQELRRTASAVYNDYGNEFVVFLSGGTDSEIVVRNFLEIGVKPRCVFVEFENGYNAADKAEAEQIARELGVRLTIMHFDVKDFFFSGEAAEFANTIDCAQVTYLTVYYHILELGFPAVMGGELFMRKHFSPKGTFWYHCFRENEDASAMRFSHKYGIPLVNEWFSYTPEMMAYYINHPDVRSMINGERPYQYKVTSVSSKNAVLRKMYPEIIKRQKTHGFEKLLGFNYESYMKIQHNHINRMEPSLDGVPVDRFLI